jgi:hypothetical protein
MLGDLMGEAAFEPLAHSAEAAGAEHDHSGVDLVRDVEDALPRRRVKLAARLRRKAGGTR